MTIQGLVEESFEKLKKAGLATPRLDSEVLIAKALKANRVDLLIRSQSEVSLTEQEIIRQWIHRRSQGEPVAYLTGEKEFFSRVFRVCPGVLIPRPETECIVEQVLNWRDQSKGQKSLLNIIDLGTGSGCLGLSLLCEIPDSQLLAVDLAQEAKQMTKENAEQLNILDRLVFLLKDASQLTAQDLPEKFQGTADIVVANPPYIDPEDMEVDPFVIRYEPPQALFAEDQGLQAIREWCSTAARVLRPEGIYIFEIGSRQGPMAKEIAEGLNVFTTVRIGQDYAGLDRWIFCQKGLF